MTSCEAHKAEIFTESAKNEASGENAEIINADQNNKPGMSDDNPKTDTSDTIDKPGTSDDNP